MNEHKLTKKVKRYLRGLDGVYYLKVHGGRFQRAGVPDLWIVAGGRSLQVELKAPDERPEPTAIQRNQLEKHARAGGWSVVCNSLEAVQKVVTLFVQGYEVEAIFRIFDDREDVQFVHAR